MPPGLVRAPALYKKQRAKLWQGRDNQKGNVQDSDYYVCKTEEGWGKERVRQGHVWQSSLPIAQRGIQVHRSAHWW